MSLYSSYSATFEFSQLFASTCLSPQFHLEIQLKAENVSVSFKSSLSPWALYQRVMHSLCLA